MVGKPGVPDTVRPCFDSGGYRDTDRCIDQQEYSERSWEIIAVAKISPRLVDGKGESQLKG